ncbi:hypothetical protein [Lacrimispora brassicae]
MITGPVIVVIGNQPGKHRINDATGSLSFAGRIIRGIPLNLGIVTFAMLVVILCSIFAHGFFKLVPIPAPNRSRTVLRSCGWVCSQRWISAPWGNLLLTLHTAGV